MTPDKKMETLDAFDLNRPRVHCAQRSCVLLIMTGPVPNHVAMYQYMIPPPNDPQIAVLRVLYA